jgi:hypothetical protein
MSQTLSPSIARCYGLARVPTAGKAQARSRLSNGRDVLPNVDGRSLVARRYRDIMCAVASDQGGAERLP